MSSRLTLNDYVKNKLDDGNFAIFFSPVLKEIKCFLDDADRARIKTISFPRGVSTISDSVFFGSKKMSVLNLPYKLETIGKSAFENCISLEEVFFPENVVSIDKEAFKGCKSLRKVVLSKSLSEFAADVFKNCPLDSLTIYASYGDWGYTLLRDIFSNLPSESREKFELTIRYGSYKEIKSFISQIKGMEKFFRKFSKMKIVLEGKKLTFFEQANLRALLVSYGGKVVFKNDEKNVEQDKSSKYSLSDNAKQVFDKLGEVKQFFSEEIITRIDAVISTIYDDYLIKIEDPKFSSGEHGEDSVDYFLFWSLHNLLVRLYENKAILRLISDVHKAKKFFDEVKSDKVPERLDDVVSFSQMYIYFFSRIDRKYEKLFPFNDLLKLFEEFLKKYDGSLEEILNRDNSDKFVEATGDMEQIKKLLEEKFGSLRKFYEKQMKYQITRYTLESVYSDEGELFQGTTVIAMLVLSLHSTISQIETEEIRELYRRKLKDFCDEYAREISLLDIEGVSDDYYDELELKMIEVLSKISSDVAPYVPVLCNVALK